MAKGKISQSKTLNVSYFKIRTHTGKKKKTNTTSKHCKEI